MKTIFRSLLAVALLLGMVQISTEAQNCTARPPFTSSGSAANADLFGCGLLGGGACSPGVVAALTPQARFMAILRANAICAPLGGCPPANPCCVPALNAAVGWGGGTACGPNLCTVTQFAAFSCICAGGAQKPGLGGYVDPVFVPTTNATISCNPVDGDSVALILDQPAGLARVAWFTMDSILLDITPASDTFYVNQPGEYFAIVEQDSLNFAISNEVTVNCLTASIPVNSPLGLLFIAVLVLIIGIYAVRRMIA